MLISLVEVSSQVFILFVLIAVGFICTKAKVFNENAIKCLTNFILFFVTPCVIISSFNREYNPELGKKLIISVVSAILLHGMNIALSYLFVHDKNKAKKCVLQYGIIFSNCGYMALPLQKALLGDEGVFLGAAYIAVFNLVTWTFGVFLMSGKKSEITLKKIFINPGIIGIAIGLLIFLTPLQLPNIISAPIQHLANLNTPIPMLVIGFYLAQITSFRVLKDINLLIGILVRLVVCPLLALLFLNLCGLNGMLLVVLIIAISAPSAANTTMFSARFEKDTQTSVAMVAFSTLLSIFTMPLIVSLAMHIS